MVRGQIQQMIAQVLQETYTIKQNAEDIYVDHPTVESFGDYTSNIALMLIKHLPKEQKQSPLEIAKKIAEKLSEKDKGGLFEKIEAVSPGFINFTLSLSYLHTFLRSKFKENIQEVQIKTTEKFLIEHTGPNTNKPLHIGHVRNAILGTAILNILHEAGYNVIAANINNDRGIHIIKSMYGYLRYGVVAPHDSKDTSNLWSYKEALTNWSSNPSAWHTPQTLKKKPDHLVGHYYILGNNAYEDSEKKAEESGVSHPSDPHNQMQQMLIDWEAEEENIRKLWKQNNDWFYEGMHQTLRDYNFHSPNDSSKFFDKEWYESELYKKGKDIIIEKIGNGVIQECEDGHVEAVLEKYNLPNIVLLRKNKTSLYIIQDIELFRQRIKEDHTDKLMILTDAGQNLRFQQLLQSVNHSV
jgi:arginyl-tRNA synthetase